MPEGVRVPWDGMFVEAMKNWPSITVYHRVVHVHTCPAFCFFMEHLQVGSISYLYALNMYGRLENVQCYSGSLEFVCELNILCLPGESQVASEVHESYADDDQQFDQGMDFEEA